MGNVSKVKIIDAKPPGYLEQASQLASLASLAQLDGKLGFGVHFGPIMIRGDWDDAHGWGDFSVQPLEEIRLHPAAAVIQYSQTIFEGMKAFHGVDDEIRLFRPEFHAARFARSAERVCLPPVPQDLFIELAARASWENRAFIPRHPGTSLYVRPTLYGREAFLGVRPSRQATLIFLVSPVGTYFEKGAKPLKILIEKEDVRAARGGIGAAKTGANYVASLRAAERAKKQGYDQVLWLDGNDHDHIEEVGTMNIFFSMGGKVITPKLTDSILPGCTRDAVIQILKDWKIPVEEKPVSIQDLAAANKAGELEAIFGTGTAAIIAPVSELSTADQKLTLRPSGKGDLCERLYNEIYGTQIGKVADRHEWIRKVTA